MRIFIICRPTHSSAIINGTASSLPVNDVDASFSSQMSGLTNTSFLSTREAARTSPQILCFQEFPIYTGLYEHYKQSSRYDPTK